MPADVSSITLIPEERRNLKKLKHGTAIPDESAIALNHLGLSEPIYGQEPDGSVSILGWKISADGLRWLRHHHDQNVDKFWNRFFTALAILISLAALLLEMDDRGFLGGLFDGFRTNQSVPQSLEQSQSEP